MNDVVGIITEPTERQLRLAAAWHGGQSSMMYAVASTGTMALGTIRPQIWYNNKEYGPASDAEWKAMLIENLIHELRCIAGHWAEEPVDAAIAEEWADSLEFEVPQETES
jgi:hypothetical protein